MGNNTENPPNAFQVIVTMVGMGIFHVYSTLSTIAVKENQIYTQALRTAEVVNCSGVGIFLLHYKFHSFVRLIGYKIPTP